MAWRIYDEALEMVEQRFRFLPHIFRWRGQQHHVDAVERCWTVSRPGWKRRVERRYFQVLCADGTFQLYQDLRTNTWHLRRAKLAPSRVATVRHVAPAWR